MLSQLSNLICRQKTREMSSRMRVCKLIGCLPVRQHTDTRTDIKKQQLLVLFKGGLEQHSHTLGPLQAYDNKKNHRSVIRYDEFTREKNWFKHAGFHWEIPTFSPPYLFNLPSNQAIPDLGFSVIHQSIFWQPALHASAPFLPAFCLLYHLSAPIPIPNIRQVPLSEHLL